MRASLLLLSAALGCVLAGCAANAFSAAKKADTAEAYRGFLREYPKDDNAEPAQARLADLELERAQKLHTVLGYKRYLEEFPDSAGAYKAKVLLEGLRFNAAKDEGTPGALRQFLREHPDGAQAEEARKRIAELELAEASRVEDPKQLARLIAEHPEDPRRTELEARLDGKAFAEARVQGASRLLQYLRDFPAGAHREEARVLLLSLKLEGLIFSGLLEEAQAEAARSPLAARLPDLAARLAAAQAERTVRQSSEPVIQGAFAGHYLREFEDLVKGLQAPDPLDRWQAAEELGQYVSVKTLEPLLSALRSSRNPLVRQKAFESLGTVLRALPRQVAEYEIALRLEALREGGESADASLAIAALLDLSGRLEAAASEYQKAFDPRQPDPVVLRRWIQIRQERRQAFSSAVAARQLGLWAKGVAEGAELSGEGGVPLALARQLCAAVVGAREASRAVALARREKTEFPEDLAEFERQVEAARKLAEARLADAELLLRTREKSARTCDDRQVSERLQAALAERGAALMAVPARAPRLARRVLEAARQKDPSFEIRARAQALMATLPPDP